MTEMWPGMALKLDMALEQDSKDHTGLGKITKTVVRVSNGLEKEPLRHSLSGGEERRVSLALMFGFIDVMRKRRGFKCNLLLLDEVPILLLPLCSPTHSTICRDS